MQQEHERRVARVMGMAHPFVVCSWGNKGIADLVEMEWTRTFLKGIRCHPWGAFRMIYLRSLLRREPLLHER